MVGDTNFRFQESEPVLANDISKCLFTTLGDVPKISIYADYTGWHHRVGYFAPHGKYQDHLAMSETLGEIGLSAIYNVNENSWDIFDVAADFGVRLQCGVDTTPVWEASAPLARFCNWIALTDDKIMVHAASVALDGIGALLVGNGGAGKSGTTAGALMRGFQSAGDDYTLIPAKGKHRAYRIYKTIKQDPTGIARLGLPTMGALNWQGKEVFDPLHELGQGIDATAPINVLLMPETGASKTTFRPINADIIFKTLTFSTLKQLGFNHAHVFLTCANLARKLPCYKMSLSSDNDEITTRLKEFLGHL